MNEADSATFSTLPNSLSTSPLPPDESSLTGNQVHDDETVETFSTPSKHRSTSPSPDEPFNKRHSRCPSVESSRSFESGSSTLTVRRSSQRNNGKRVDYVALAEFGKVQHKKQDSQRLFSSESSFPSTPSKFWRDSDTDATPRAGTSVSFHAISRKFEWN